MNNWPIPFVFACALLRVLQEYPGLHLLRQRHPRGNQCLHHLCLPSLNFPEFVPQFFLKKSSLQEYFHCRIPPDLSLQFSAASYFLYQNRADQQIPGKHLHRTFRQTPKKLLHRGVQLCQRQMLSFHPQQYQIFWATFFSFSEIQVTRLLSLLKGRFRHDIYLKLYLSYLQSFFKLRMVT